MVRKKPGKTNRIFRSYIGQMRDNADDLLEINPMSRQPTLKQLRYLCALAQHQHFGNAAKSCHVSQSTLSASIVELEEVLSISLVERNNRSVLLTSVGSEVVERARGILTDVDDIVSLCEASREPFQGTIRLGVIPTIAPFILPSMLKSLRAQYPLCKLFVREDLSKSLVDALQVGELDVLLLALPFPADQTDTLNLFEDPFYLAAMPDSRLVQSSKLRTRDLQGAEMLLLEEGHCLRDHALEACKLREKDVTVPYQATSLTTIVQMVANGIGTTLLPKMATDAGIADGTNLVLRPFDEPDVGRHIGLMWRKKTPRKHEFGLLGAFIQECLDND
jgi:LysR family hydrogen peroxide-inducible transcriptional activator